MQKRGLAVGLGALSEGQFTRCNTRRLIAPALQSPGQEARPFAAGADGFAGAPNLCPAPPPPPPPAPSASAYLALGEAGRGSGRLLSLSRP